MAESKSRSRKRARTRAKARSQDTAKFNPTTRKLFVDKLRASGSVFHACTASGLKRRTVYDWKQRSKDFAAEWDEAFQDAQLRLRCELEQTIWDKAVNGWLEPVFFEGKPCGAVRKFSPSLIIFALKAKCGWRDDEVDPNSNSEREAASNFRAMLLLLSGSVPKPGAKQLIDGGVPKPAPAEGSAAP